MPTKVKIALECGSCGATVKGPESAVGRAITCPRCKKKAVFDRPLDLAPVEDEPEARFNPEPEPIPPARERVFSGEDCGGCGAELEEGAVVCVACGRDLRLGLNIETVAAAKSAGSFGLAVGVGLGVAILAGVVWAAIAVYARVQISFVAIGIGVAAAFAMALVTQERSVRTGLAAMAVAALGLLLGKILMVNGFATVVFEDELLQNQSALVRLLAVDKARSGALDEAVVEAFLDREAPVDPEVRKAADKLVFELRSELRTLDWDRKRALIAPVVDRFLDDISYTERIRIASNFWDLLWFSLALGAAWKITQPS